MRCKAIPHRATEPSLPPSLVRARGHPSGTGRIRVHCGWPANQSSHRGRKDAARRHRSTRPSGHARSLRAIPPSSPPGSAHLSEKRQRTRRMDHCSGLRRDHLRPEPDTAKRRSHGDGRSRATHPTQPPRKTRPHRRARQSKDPLLHGRDLSRRALIASGSRWPEKRDMGLALRSRIELCWGARPPRSDVSLASQRGGRHGERRFPPIEGGPDLRAGAKVSTRSPRQDRPRAHGLPQVPIRSAVGPAASGAARRRYQGFEI